LSRRPLPGLIRCAAIRHYHEVGLLELADSAISEALAELHNPAQLKVLVRLNALLAQEN
jgi:hypothetical protein